MMTFSDRERQWWTDFQDGVPARRGIVGLKLAAALAGRGESVAAEGILRTVAAQGSGASARAAYKLGSLLLDLGRRVEAERAFEAAAQLCDPLETADVQIDLAARWAALGRDVDARRAYQAVLEFADDERRADAGLAAWRLGHLLNDAGEREAAIDMWRRASADADESLRPHALYDLAIAQQELGFEQESETPLRECVASDDPDLAPRAAIALGDLLCRRGEEPESERFYALAVSSEHPDHVPTARRRLGELAHARVRNSLRGARADEQKLSTRTWLARRRPGSTDRRERAAVAAAQDLTGWLTGSCAHGSLSTRTRVDPPDVDVIPLLLSISEASASESGLWLPKLSDVWEAGLGRLRDALRRSRPLPPSIDTDADRVPSLMALVDAVVERQRHAFEAVDATVGECLDAFAAERWSQRVFGRVGGGVAMQSLGRGVDRVLDRCLRLVPVDGVMRGARALVDVIESAFEPRSLLWRPVGRCAVDDDAVKLCLTEQLLHSSLGVQMTMTRSTGKSFLAMHVSYVVSELQYRDELREPAWLDPNGPNPPAAKPGQIGVRPWLHEDAPGAREWQVSWEAVADYLRHRGDGDSCGR
jgi:tetratricopeptide (TPR) repeat protein